MELLTQAPVRLSAAAADEMKRLLSLDTSRPFIRIGVKGGGCSGMSYVLDYDMQQDDDTVYEIDGVPVLMSKAHEMYLYGMEVDFESGLNARGFVFHNPNASSTCGCGSSFSV